MESYLIVQHDNFLKLLKFKEHEKYLSMSTATIKAIMLLILGFISIFNMASALTPMKVMMRTGGDDLRGNGNPLIGFTGVLRTKTWLRM